MSKYRSVPWKRNVRKVPRHIRAKIRSARVGDLLIVSASKQVSRDAVEQGHFSHLGFDVKSGELTFENLVPPAFLGPYSTKNREGWTVVRHDLPMISKTFSAETPNFGDWSYGSHTVYWDREVYQREYHEPPHRPVTIDVLKSGNDNWIVRFTVAHLLKVGGDRFEDDLLFCLNLLQENAGVIDIFPHSATPEEYLASIQLEWQIFPPGSVDEVLDRFSRRTSVGPKPEHIEIMRKRVEVFSSLDPIAYVYGVGGLNHYVGAKFKDNLVVFENIRYGNAIYVLYENWTAVSKRSRTELLNGTDADFDRIIHTVGWEDRLKSLILKKRAARAA